MDDLWVRLALVSVLTLAVIVGARRVRRSRPGSSLERTGLAPGVYLFTARTCGDCGEARRRLAGRAFTEVEWETDPGLFAELGITRVPGTLIVAVDGSGAWHEGVRADLGNP
ncbi:MAG: hypothetical protein L0Z63_04170 [Actinobacteria bacterium]|nr:hypothetical protein [Actinomycetota bacterium]